jgi:hypothetical protein
MANFDELRDEYNVVEVTEMKTRKTNALLNMTKCVLKDESIKSEMLRNKFIFVGLTKFYIDDFTRPPVQCNKCKSFGHIEKNCINALSCRK